MRKKCAIFFYFRHNCTVPLLQQTTECAFECIKILYDVDYCTFCSKGEKLTTVNSESNHTLGSLVQHDFLYHNESLRSIASANCEGKGWFLWFLIKFHKLSFFVSFYLDCTVNKTDAHIFERYSKPIDLVKFVNCTRHIAGNSNSSIDTNCTIEQINGLYENITDRLKEKEWCINILGIRAQVREWVLAIFYLPFFFRYSWFFLIQHISGLRKFVIFFSQVFEC